MIASRMRSRSSRAVPTNSGSGSNVTYDPPDVSSDITVTVPVHGHGHREHGYELPPMAASRYRQ